MKKVIARQAHEFSSFLPSDANILILGSFPSVKSREQGFYYMHPQNRFYKVLSEIFQEDFYSCSIEEKKILLAKHHIALYDVIASCDIVGSSDESIENVEPIHLKDILDNYPIQQIYLNGKKAAEMFKKYLGEYVNLITELPSTSPANCRYSLKDLVHEWKVIKK